MSSRQARHRKIPTWFSVKEAHALQLGLSKHVVRQDTFQKRIQYVAGIDIAYTKGFSIGGVIVLDYQSLSPIESKTARIQTSFPYIPTLLSFREIPPAYAVVKKLRMQPDVFLVDGQGIMHPYRLGFASHLGLILDKPTIGVAKKPLIGKIGEYNKERWAPITDKEEVVGASLVTKEGAKPIYVSIGHMVSLTTAIKIVKQCTPTHRIPKPNRLAHNEATKEKRKSRKTRADKKISQFREESEN